MSQRHRKDRKPEAARGAAGAASPSGPPAEVRAVVGIGASAGGFEALIALFGALPDDLGAAYVVALHAGPSSESHLRDILARPGGAEIRIWAAGCATGEEAYSLAMLVQERAEEARKSFELEVFATDTRLRTRRSPR